MRLFAALELPAEARAALAAWGQTAVGEAPAARLLAADALHVTLVFLGEQPPGDAAAIAAALAGAAGPLAPLRVAGAAWLPPHRPGVLVADLEPGADVVALQARVVAALAAWHEPEARPFRPHVTVARVRRGERVSRRAVAPPPALSFAAQALVLYRSLPGATGAAYAPVASVPLDGGRGSG